jgi:hypothetical protein
LRTFNATTRFSNMTGKWQASFQIMACQIEARGALRYLGILIPSARSDAQGADWREVTRIVLHLDPEHESHRVRRAFDSHLSRAKWVTEHSYRHLLRGGASA